MHNNEGGNYATTDKAMMRAFDKLPKRLRQALANANENWVPQPFRTQFERDRPVDDLVKQVRLWDMMDRTAVVMRKRWGSDRHPQAIAMTVKGLRKRFGN